MRWSAWRFPFAAACLLGSAGCGNGSGNDSADASVGGFTSAATTRPIETTGSATSASTTTTDGTSSSTMAPTDTSAATESPGDSSTSSSGATDTDSPSEPSVELLQLTTTNRAYVEMHGGWGPHLRAPMSASDGTLWFAYDGGPSVLSNTQIHYARLADGVWETVASQAHVAGVQQNTAHVLQDDVVLTYGVSIGSSVLEECTFSTASTQAACNVIEIGGAYTTPPSSNYVGAALGPNGARVVWFTVVGNAGGTGSFVYTYNFGGGWNGPVTTVLPGYNDFSYVRAFMPAPNVVEWLGEAYVGNFPNGATVIGTGEASLGVAPAFLTLDPPAPPGELARNAGDIWIDPASGDAHALGRAGANMYYFHRPFGASWANHLEPVEELAGVTSGRWLHAEGGPLVAIVSGGGVVRAIWADPVGAIDWTLAEALDIVVPAAGFDRPAAIYAMGPEYQSAPATGLHFALCGQYGVSDNEIWHGHLTLD